MGAPKTSTVGGGSATPTANAYNSYLQGNVGASNTAINGLLSGNTPSPGSGYFQNSGMANLPNAPTFTQANTQGLNNNLTLNTNNNATALSGMPSTSNAQTMMSGATNPLSSGMASGAFNASAPAASMNFLGTSPSQYGVANVNMPNADVNSARANAIGAITNQQNALNLANTNARYSAGGMSALGSGASLAGAQQNAVGQNQLVAALQGVTQQDITNNLNYGQLNSSNQLQAQNMSGQDTLSRLGLQNSNLLGNAQIGANVSMANAANNLSAANSLSGMNQSGINSLLNYASTQGGLNLQGQGMDANNGLNQFNANNNATQTNNTNNITTSQNLNNFLSQMFGQNSSNALQNQNMSNTTGLGLQSNQLQGMLQSLGLLNSGMMQSNSIGNPQSQTIQTPSTFQQIMSGLQSATGIASGLMGIPGMSSNVTTGSAPLQNMQLSTPSATTGVGGYNPNMFQINPNVTMGGTPASGMINGLNPNMFQLNY